MTTLLQTTARYEVGEFNEIKHKDLASGWEITHVYEIMEIIEETHTNIYNKYMISLRRIEERDID